jgi:hypothetical protein
VTRLLEQRGELVAASILVVIAVLIWLLAPTYPNYDAYFHLVWGRDLIEGRTPSFEAFAAPTEHPLYVALCAVLALAGSGADRLLVLVCLLAFVALLIGTWRLTAATFGRWPGIAAAVLVGISPLLVLYALRAFVDVPFLALMVWAAALLAARPMRLGPAMVLLALAGLLRPEAWVFAGAVALWQGHHAPARTKALLALAVVAPPAIWALVDLVATGEPLRSFADTGELTAELNRPTGIFNVPAEMARGLTATVTPLIAGAGVVGVVLAWARMGPRRIVVPLGVLVLGVAVFAAIGVAGLSLIPRYLALPAVALCVFAGYAVLGFAELPKTAPARASWRRLAVAAIVIGIAVALLVAPSAFRRVNDELRFARGTHRDLAALLDKRPVRAGMACGPVTFPTFRMVPDAQWILDDPDVEVTTRAAFDAPQRRGVEVFVIGRTALRRLGFADGVSPLTNIPDPGFRRTARSGRFAAYTRC